MAEIRRYPFIRHLRSEASSHVLHSRGVRLLHSGRGLGYTLLTTAEVEAWSTKTPVQHFHAGRALSRRLGWFEQLAPTNADGTERPGRKKKLAP